MTQTFGLMQNGQCVQIWPFGVNCCERKSSKTILKLHFIWILFINSYFSI
jgi:hypothetical protein